MKEKAANGHNTVEEAYVAGLDPTSATSELEATVACSNGVVYVGWTPYLNSNCLARVYRILGKCDLSDPNEEWQPVGAGLGSVSVVSDSTILSGLDSGDGAVFIPKGTHLALPIPAALPHHQACL